MRGGALAAAAALGLAAAHDRPIIGVLTLPNDVDASQGRSYFPASYVKWLESGGARVVALPYTTPLASLAGLLKSINGALFTGGGAAFTKADGSLTEFATAAQLIFNESVAAAAAGESWPLHGTCLGHELISFLAADAAKGVLTPGWDSENISLVTTFTPAAASSRLWGSAPADVVAAFATLPIAMNAHQQGVAPAAFKANGPLSSRFRILATALDRGGNEFVASSEGISLPIYTTQFHPEKPVYEWWALEDINHSPVSVYANSWTQRFFVNQSRANDRTFPDAASEAAALIYNTPPVATYATSPGFEQCYFFP